MFIFRKIRWNAMFFFALSGMLPLAVFAFLVLERTHADFEKSLTRESSKMAAQARASITGQFDACVKQLENLASFKEIKSFDRSKQSEIISSFFKLNPIFYNLYIYDSEGILRNIDYPGEANEGVHLIGKKDIRDSRGAIINAFETAKRDRRSVVSEYFTNHFGEVVFTIATPIFAVEDGERVIGVLSAAAKVSDSAFHRFFDHVKLRWDEYILLVNESSEVMTMKGDLLPADLGRFDFPVTVNGERTVVNMKEITNGTAYIGNRRDMIYTVPIEVLRSTVIIGRPYDQAYMTIRRMVRYVVWTIIGSLLFAAGLGVLLADGLVRPITKLIEGINRIGEGALGHRIDLSREDEIGEAVTAFNSLAQKLQRNRMIEVVWSDKWRKKE